MKVNIIRGPQTDENIEKCYAIIRRFIIRAINGDSLFKEELLKMKGRP